MSALSQGLEFSIYNNTSSVAVIYPNNTSTTQVYNSYKEKGSGYYGSATGFHTVMYTANHEFNGTITMQASLATEPIEADWFDVNSTSVSYQGNDRTDSTVDYFNFAGNFVWVRGQVTIDRGTVQSILYNH
jgi:hypothetical protein